MRASINCRHAAVVFLVSAICMGSMQAEESHQEAYSQGSHRVGAREPRYHFDGAGQVSTSDHPPVSVIDFERGRVAVETSRLLFDDEEVATLPDGAKIIHVPYSESRLLIAADGTAPPARPIMFGIGLLELIVIAVAILMAAAVIVSFASKRK
jgi:hypothetical protein